MTKSLKDKTLIPLKKSKNTRINLCSRSELIGEEHQQPELSFILLCAVLLKNKIKKNIYIFLKLPRFLLFFLNLLYFSELMKH